MATNWLFWSLLSAAFAALTGLLSALGLRRVDPDAAQLVRTAVVLLVVAALAVVTGAWQGLATFTNRTWIYLVLAGMATAASWICYYRALAAGDAARVAAIDKLSVPMLAVAAIAVLGQRLGLQGWIGVALSAAGAMLISLEK